MRVALYFRVSTKKQSVDRQRDALREWARHAGHEVVAEFSDEGVSASRRKVRRPQFEAMKKAATRREFQMLAVWALDRLGRNMKETVTAIHDLDALEIPIFLHQQAVDTSTPSGKMFAYMAGMFAEAESQWLSDRIHSGLDTARKKGVKLGPKYASSTPEGKRCDLLIRDMLRSGTPVREIKARLGVGSTRVYRVKNGIAA